MARQVGFDLIKDVDALLSFADDHGFGFFRAGLARYLSGMMCLA